MEGSPRNCHSDIRKIIAFKSYEMHKALMTNLNEMAFCLRELGEKDIIHISCCLAALFLSYHPRKRKGTNLNT